MADSSLTRQSYYAMRLGALRTERSSFISHYQEISEYFMPRRGRFLMGNRNKGDKRYKSIINSASVMSRRTAVAGLQSGLTSPARPWFHYETPDREMMKFKPVRLWLEQVENLHRAILAASNFYNMMPVMYGELLGFGTGAMTITEDFEDVVRFYTHTVGSYMISQNHRLEVDTLYREVEMTVEQIVSQFGKENASSSVRDAYDKGNYSAWIPVIHAIEPNQDRDLSSKLSKNKPFRSVYFERGMLDGNLSSGFLSEKGFDEFPAIVPRWDLTGEDIYGTDCPGMIALGDVKQLQAEERRKAQGIDKMVAPPLKGPGSLKNHNIENLPGGVTLYDGDTTNEGLRPIYEVRLPINELRQDINDLENRIGSAFYADLFLQLQNMEGVQPRNVMELAQRNEEKLLMLGPVLERLEHEGLDRALERLFNMTVKANLLPPPPPELSGQVLRVEYVGPLAQAQRAIATQGIDRLTNFVGGVSGFDEDARDKFNTERAIDEYAVALGTTSTILNSDDEVAAIREARARQQQLQQQMAMAESMSNVAKNASDSSTEGGNLLSQLTQGGGPPQGQEQ